MTFAMVAARSNIVAERAKRAIAPHALPDELKNAIGRSHMSPWYVVHTKPRQEQLAAENLLRQHYAVYLPRIKLFKHLRGRQQIQFEPLFPRYLFVRPESDAHSIAPIRSTLGVSNLVRFGNQPALMRNETLNAIRAFEAGNHDAPDVEISPFKPGKRIQVVGGPLCGLEGMVSDVRQDRVLVLLNLLGHETRVNLRQRQLKVTN